jgi:hypothetical protein
MRLKLLPVTLLLVSLLSAVGLGQNRKSPRKPKADPLTEITSQPAPTSSAADQFDKRIQELEQKVLALEVNSFKDFSVDLDVAHPDRYQRLSSNTGTFLVSFSNAERYLDGYKIRLSIGNITTATFSGFELTLRFGTKEPEAGVGHDWLEWYRTVRTKTETFTRELKPGRWNVVEIIVLPARPDELGYLQVRLRTDEVMLQSEEKH